MPENKSPIQPRVGLAGGAVIFLVFGIVWSIGYFQDLSAGSVPGTASIIGMVIGFTSAAILGYWAARSGRGVAKPVARDYLLLVVLAVVTGSALSLALWWAAQ